MSFVQGPGLAGFEVVTMYELGQDAPRIAVVVGYRLWCSKFLVVDDRMRGDRGWI